MSERDAHWFFLGMFVATVASIIIDAMEMSRELDRLMRRLS